MRCFLLLVGWCLLFARSTSAAAPPADTAVLRITRLPTDGLLLTKGWRYHAGDDPAWAQPDFDDSRWDTINPNRPRKELPTDLSNGISWLRLRFRLGDSLRRRELLANTFLLGACEVYLNGQLLTRQGKVDADPNRVEPQPRLPLPDQVLAGGPAGDQVLAVRYTPWQGPLLGGMVQAPLLRFSLIAPHHFWANRDQEKGSALVFVVLMGFSVLLAVLHFAFFHYNPSQRANLYFALFALTAALGSLTAYLFRVLPLSWPVFLTIVVISNLLAAMNGLWAIRALHALFKSRPGRFYKALWVNYAVLSVLFVVFISYQAVDFWWTFVVVVHLAEQVRLTVRAVRQSQRGAWLVAVGFASGMVSALVYALVYVLRGPNSMTFLQNLTQNMTLALGFALPAMGISLFLAREFALDAELLQVKLGEVERLSAQTIAQKQEKQALLAAQNEMLEQQVAQRTGELQHSLTELRTTQTQLIQKEKMASLGELTAGIAHEIQNPLNFVNNFAEVSAELVEELQEALAANDSDEAAALAGDLAQNMGKIGHHGRRAAGIVKGMLEHSNASTGERQPTDLNRLCDEYLRLAYQGLRAKDKGFNAELTTDFMPDLPWALVVSADVGRVLLNLFTNAFYAVRQRQLTGEPGYQPLVGVATERVNGQPRIRVRDNGTGMPDDIKAKVFQPFFTTKPTGEGTGLGLSLSYDIVTKGHGGTLTFESQPGQGTTFCIELPLNAIAV